MKNRKENIRRLCSGRYYILQGNLFMDVNIYKIAIAGFLHDIGKFAERGGMDVDSEFLKTHANLYQPFFNDRHTHKHAVYMAAFIDHVEKLLPKDFNKSNWGTIDKIR